MPYPVDLFRAGLNSSRPLLVIGGPTASGKSGLALSIAKERGSLIVNADSMQVYRELPILTAQPSAEEQATLPHALYGHVPAARAYSVSQWLEESVPLIQSAMQRAQHVIIVGGTGMYLGALMDGISDIPEADPDIRNTLRRRLKNEGSEMLYRELMEKDPATQLKAGDGQRIVRALEVILSTGRTLQEWQSEPAKTFFATEDFDTILVMPEREVLYRQCNQRLEAMIKAGAIEEVDALLKQNLSPDLPAMRALGVPEFSAYLKGTLTKDAALALAQQKTRNYAKRQVTWFKNQWEI